MSRRGPGSPTACPTGGTDLCSHEVTLPLGAVSGLERGPRRGACVRVVRTGSGGGLGVHITAGVIAHSVHLTGVTREYGQVKAQQESALMTFYFCC